MAAKTAFIDFVELKNRVGIEQMARMALGDLNKKGQAFKAPCPLHGGEITISPHVVFKRDGTLGVFCCHSSAGSQGGDGIGLVAHVRQIGQKEAADLIASHFGPNPGEPRKPAPAVMPERISANPPREAQADLAAKLGKIAAELKPEHEAVQALDIDADTAKTWGVGWKGNGPFGGRVLFPLKDHAGVLKGFACFSPEKSPNWLLPDNIDPEHFIFGADAVQDGGHIVIAATPADVVRASQYGDQAVCFLTQEKTAYQAELFAALLARKNCTW